MSIGGQARCCWTRLNSENGKRLWRWLRGNQRGCSSEAALLNCVKFGDEANRRVSSDKYWTDVGHCGGSNYPLSVLHYAPAPYWALVSRSRFPKKRANPRPGHAV